MLNNEDGLALLLVLVLIVVGGILVTVLMSSVRTHNIAGMMSKYR